jgi:hypothetical protein
MTLTCAFCDDLLGQLSRALAQLRKAEVALNRAAGTPENGLLLEVCIARQAFGGARRRMTEHIFTAHQQAAFRFGTGETAPAVRTVARRAVQSVQPLGLRKKHVSKS